MAFSHRRPYNRITLGLDVWAHVYTTFSRHRTAASLARTCHALQDLGARQLLWQGVTLRPSHLLSFSLFTAADESGRFPLLKKLTLMSLAVDSDEDAGLRPADVDDLFHVLRKANALEDLSLDACNDFL